MIILSTHWLNLTADSAYILLDKMDSAYGKFKLWFPGLTIIGGIVLTIIYDAMKH